MQTAQLNLKLQQELFGEIEVLSKVLHIPKNEWARNVLAYEVKKELEEHKQFIVREYLKGALSKQELLAVLSPEEVQSIERLLTTGKKSREDARILAAGLR